MSAIVKRRSKIRDYYESVFSAENVNAFLTDKERVLRDDIATDLFVIIAISTGMEREILRAMGKHLSNLSRFSFSPMTGLCLVSRAMGYTGYHEISRRFGAGDFVPNIRNDLLAVADPLSRIVVRDKQVKTFF